MKALWMHLFVALTVSVGCIDDTQPPYVGQDDRDRDPALGVDDPSGVAEVPVEPVEAEPVEPEPEPVEPEPEPVEPEPVEPEPVEPEPVEPEPEPVEPEPVEPTTKVVLLLPGTSIAAEEFTTMYHRLLDDGFVPVVYEEPDMFTGSLAAGAAWVGDVVASLQDEFDVDQIDIVGQCDAGVVARYYATLLDGAPNVRHLVTLVAPHHGSQLSGVGSWITGWQALTDVRPGSAFLETLNAAPLPSGLDMTSIYSCNDELMVPYTTSVVEGAANVEFCDRYVTHLSAFDDAQVYARIRMSLDGIADAPTYY